jgi:hypothetical protein
MLKRLILIALLLISVSAQAAEYTDVYFDPDESGWGVFLVQSDATQFLAFFIYGADGKPTWYVAIISNDGTGNYTGALYATTGTYFPNPWQGDQVTTAGTVSFQPIDAYHAKLIYTVNGVATVTKTIQRQTLTAYALGGTYTGSGAGSINSCASAGQNEPSYRSRYVLTVTQTGDQSATLVFNFVDSTHNGLVCTLTGPLTHIGRLYQLNGQSTCTFAGQPVGAPQAVTIDALHTIGHGIEGHITAIQGCVASVHFAAVFASDN